MAFAPIARLLRLLPLAALGALLAGSTPAKAESEKVDEAFLWRVEGGQKTSYLFGTVHAGVGAEELPEVVQRSVVESEVFVLEANPGAELDRLRRSGQPLPMDFSLALNARDKGLPLASLETPRFQMELLSRVANHNELAAMLSEGSEDLELIASAYRSGNVERIAQVSDPGDEAMRELLLSGRNRRWVRQLRPLLQRGGAFVAVGVGHLPGDEGLVSLLRERGYSVSRV